MRSEKARISVKFSRLIVIMLSVLMVLMLVMGAILIVMSLPLGWIFIGFAAVPAMMVEWYKGELHHLAIKHKPQSIDDVLSADILGRLPKKPSPRDVATIVGQVSGGQFYTARFGISNKFLQDLSSDSKEDMQSVWQAAWEIRNQTGSDNISAAVILTALVSCAPKYETLLSHLQLNLDDLKQGIDWYNHLRNLIDDSKKPRRTGGFARDWSFGWTPLLNRFGQNISHQVNTNNAFSHRLAAHEDSLNQLIDIFGKDGHQNAVLVGIDGVGKTQIVHAFAAKLLDASADIPENLRFRQVFILDASSLIAAAPKRGGLEQLIPSILAEAYNAKNIIICLDNAQLFFEEGIGSVDITNVLLPVIEAGHLRMILTMDAQKYVQISNRDSKLAGILNRIIVVAASKEETIDVMQDRAILLEFQYQVTYMYQALVEAYRLGDRYVFDLAMPGKALQLLESAAHYSENGLVTAKSVQMAIEKTVGVKVSVASADDDREKLLNMEELIHKRMINQTKAVKVVSDALRRARAGVRNQNRPIGTFLFLGPTGVGKTELAKALAEVYFDGEDHMIRLDMNEYTSGADVSRLIADGASNANSLTARVMKQPFSVVLLDEIEKAHPNVLSTLLQLLDEGILRDVKNREVSFRDAIIIATSNAGADRIREYIDRGHDIAHYETQFVDELISSNQFRPEFLNRFDEIVMFKPLTKQELLQVVDMILVGVNKTLALQKVTVSVDIEAKKYLVEAGYDPRLGARPMRRVVQRAVENTVAKQMLSGDVEAGGVVNISLDQVKQILDSESGAQQIIDSK